MKLQDYLHLYIGCEGIAETIAKFKTRLVISNHTNDMRDGVDLEDAIQYNFKPILRPLSDMTEEEFREIFNPIQPKDVADEDFKDAMQNLIENGIDAFDFDGMSAQTVFELTRKLLSKHFDLFGLIEAGLAIDKTKEAAL
jgi:hypothetical protein